MKNLIFRGEGEGGGGHEKPIEGGLPKKRGWLGQFADLKGGLGMKDGVVLHTMHTMYLTLCITSSYIKAYQKVFKVLVKWVLIVNVLTSLWSVLVKFINNVFTKTLG